jgi:uncharacterized protein with PQ loop repeat
VDVAVTAGAIATVVFASSTLPMLAKAWRTKDVSSYSAGNIVLANCGNVLYAMYVVHLPLGPIWALHAFHTTSTALMLYWYIRYVVFAGSARFLLRQVPDEDSRLVPAGERGGAGVP